MYTESETFDKKDTIHSLSQQMANQFYQTPVPTMSTFQ